MSHVLRVGVTDQIAYFRAFNTDGTAKTDLTSATAGLSLSVFRANLVPVSISSLSDKAADNTTHADGAIRHVGGNIYTVDLPDAATANQCPSIGVVGSYTGGVIEPVPHPIVNYNPALVAVGANTVAPANADIASILEDTSTTLPATLTQIKGSTFAEATDALDALRAAVDAGGGGAVLTGPWTRTITVTDSVSGDPIQNATVRFFRTGETESKATNASGVATFTVEAATWSYAIVANGYAGASGTVEVSASGNTAVTLAANAPVDVTAETTALSFRVSSQGNTSLAGVVASARLIGEGFTVTGSTVGINVVEESTSDAGGLVTLVLFRESDYDLSIRRTNGTIYKLRIRTSDQATTTISAAIEV